MDGHLCQHTSGTLLFRFPYDEDDVAAIKTVPTVRWDANERGWVVLEDALDDAIEFAEDRGWEIFDEVHAMRSALIHRRLDQVALARRRMKAVGESFFEYQPQGIDFLAGRKLALLAWGQRLGKTIVGLTSTFPDHPIAIVTPGGVKYQWEEEGRKYLPDVPFDTLVGRDSWEWPDFGKAVVTNYEILPKPAMEGKKTKWVRPLPGARPGTILLVDEAHKVKNPKAQRTKALRSMVQGVLAEDGYVWFLTATPMGNSPLELWNLLQTLGAAKMVFGSFDSFMGYFRATKVDGQIVWRRPEKGVRDRLDRIMHRLTMKDVRGDMPAYLHSFLPVEVNIPARTSKILDRDFLRWKDAVAHGKPANVTQGLLATARKELAQAKIPALISLVKEYEAEGTPLVVFSAHRDPIDALAAREGWARISGAESNKRKNEVKKAFQSGELIGVACTIRAGALGITLNRAKDAVFVDLDWNPSENAQAMMRCVAVDQDEPVQIRTLVAAGTPDEDVLRDLDLKTRNERETLDRPPPRRKRTSAEPPPRRRKVRKES